MGLGKTYSTRYLADSNNNTGAVGQVLISTATGINWSNGSDIIGGPYLKNTTDTFTGELTLYQSSTVAPTLLTLSTYSGDTSNDGTMGSFIDFEKTDDNATFLPQARIGMVVKDSDGDGGIASEGCGNLVFYTSEGTDATGGGVSSEKLRITDKGNVGIGTISPSAKLEVDVGVNSLKISGRDTYIDSSIDSANANIYVTQAGVGDFGQLAGSLVLQARTQGTIYRDIIFAGGLTSGDALMTILGQGEVGIGTDGPLGKLMVRDDTAGAPTRLIVSNGGTVESGTSARLSFYEGTSEKGYIERRRDSSGKIAFVTPADDNPFVWENPTGEIMRINNSNVGIGNSDTSGARLKVLGKVVFDGHNSGDPDSNSRTAYPADQMFTHYDNNGVSIIGGKGAYAGVGLTIGEETSRSSDFKFIRGVSDTNGGALAVEEFWVNGVGAAYFATNVSIGAASASAKLHITKDNTTGNALLITNSGSSRSLEINHNADGTGVSDEVVRIMNDGTRLFTIESNANVGIGTDSPQVRLTLRREDDGSLFELNRPASGVEALYGGIVGNDPYFYSNNGIFTLGINNPDGGQGGEVSYITMRNGSTRYTTFEAGNVGIGLTVPTADLHVASVHDGMTNGLNTNQLKLSYGASVVGAGSSVAFGVSGNNNFTGAKIVHERTASNSVGDLTFWTRQSGGTATDYDLTVERMRIDSVGNVGIGNGTQTNRKLKVHGHTQVDGNMYVSGALDTYSVEVGQSRTTEGVAFLDLTGEVGPDDYGLRMIRYGGLNAESKIIHTGTASLTINAENGGDTIFTNTNVGIGTTTAQSNTSLDVRGNGSASDGAIKAYAYGGSGTSILGNGYASSGSGSNFGVRGISTGPRSTVAGSVNVGAYFAASSAETNYALLTGSGNVGIGTDSPGAKLAVHFSGLAAFIYSSQSTALRVRGGGNSQDITQFQNVGGSTVAVIDSAGSFGIGTTDPDDMLEVYGSSPNIRVTNTAETDSGIVFNDAQAGTAQMAAIKFNSSDEKLKFFVNDEVAQRMVIDTSGNVGINVVSPNQKLHVNGATQLGDINATVNFGTVALKVVEGTVSQGPTLGSGAVGAQAVLYSNGAFGMYTGVSDSGDTWMQSQRNDASTAAYDILLNPVGGNIGIGTITPSYKLDVAGTIRATGDVIAYSDARVKDNVVTIENALEKVTKLRGVSYTRNDVEDKTTKIGVIAQEVLEVLPEVVQQDDEGKYSVAYGNMVGLLIESIKELKAEVDELKSRL